MKNLKKILSLALALAMALSLMTTAFAVDASDFADYDDVAYTEAVDVMSAIGVFNGVEGNSFAPNGTLTREQAAKIITYMMLGQEQADKLVSAIAPYSDVAANRWSAGSIAYCTNEGIIAGTGNGKFEPTRTLTGLEFAKMLLVALGYDPAIEELEGSAWAINTATMAYDIDLDDGLENVTLSAPMTREQAAQMALTVMQTPLVKYDSKGTEISVNGATVSFGAKAAEYVTSTIAREQTISDQKLTNTKYYTIEFGERYCPKLELRRTPDDFGRPSYTWAYDKKEINTYLDDTDLVAEFTTKVTGKDLYEAITKNVKDNLNEFVVTIDGEESSAVNANVFTEGAVVRTNDDAVGATEKGVLTQVFVTNVNNDDQTRYDVKVVIINTYLAIATEDYDTKNEDVDLDVYALGTSSEHSSKNPDYIKNTIAKGKDGYVEKTPVVVKNEDVNVEDVKEDDKYLVTVAAGKVQTMAVPEIVSDASIDSFKLHKDVSVDGTTYEYAHTARYDVDVLDDYSQTNMKDTTYNVILDPYGYLIGIEENEEADLYVFLTGMEGNGSDLSTKNADANIIFLDGRMETVSVNVGKSNLYTPNGPQMNTWCTYSVDNKGVYTLKEVANDAFPTKGTKVAQSAMNASSDIKIDNKNVTLNGLSPAKVYGNNDSVYIAVTTEPIKAATDAGGGKYWHAVISDVDSVTVGVRNASLVAKDQTPGDGSNKEDTETSPGTPDGDGPKPAPNEVYTLFKDNGYIVAAVVIGEDDGIGKTYAYVHSDNVKRERYNKTDDEWTWVREVIIDGKIVDLTEVGGGTDLSDLKDMDQGKWYEIKRDANGNVKKATEIAFNPYANPGNTKWIDNVEDVEEAVNDEDTVILHQIGMDGTATSKLTYKNGTLFTTADQTKELGFSVSPDVKVVLCLSDGTTHTTNHVNDGCFDDVDDSYTGYSGLERAIRNLDSNFTGELNAVFDKGDAVVIILVDQTPNGEGGDDDDDDDDDNNNETHAKAVVDEGALAIESVTVVDGNYKTPIANALKEKGLRVTGWNEDTSGTATAGDTVTAVDANGTVFTFEYGTAAASPTAEYWTLKVDGEVVEEIADSADSTTQVKDITGKGTGYRDANGAYQAYNGASTTAVVSNVTAAQSISTGYVEFAAASVTSPATDNATDITDSTTVASAQAGTAGVKVGDTVTVTVTIGTVASPRTNVFTVTLNVTGVTAPAAQTFATDSTIATGDEITFTFKAGETNITGVGAVLSD